MKIRSIKTEAGYSMARAAKERRFTFDAKVPNATTRKAIEQLEKGKGKRSTSARTLVEFFGHSSLHGVKIRRSRDTGRKLVKF